MLDYNTYKYSTDETLLRGARWARDEEMMAVTRRNRLCEPDGVSSCGLPVLSDGNTVYVDDSDAHSLIIGSTGSKKSRLFAMPMLEMMRRCGESVLVTDPKGELYETTACAFHDSGYRMEVINLREPRKSNGWNPLAMARQALRLGDAEKATAIINDFAAAMLHNDNATGKLDPFWEQASTAMLQGLALMLVEGTEHFPDDTVNLATLRHLSDNFTQDESDSYFSRSSSRKGVLDLLKLYPPASICAQNLLVASHGSEKTFSNVKISYEAPMQKLYAQQSLINMLSCHEVDFTRLGSEKTILYLVMPDEKTTLHKIVSLIVKLCYEQLIDLAQQQPRCRLPLRVNFLLDEFSNLPAIPDMAAMISAARSRNIRFHLIIQGLYQLCGKYGNDSAHTIKGNCGNWVFLSSRELPLLNEISDLCGQDALTGEHLITVNQLQRLNKERGEALMLLGRQCPYIAHLADIDEYVLPRNLPALPYPQLPDQPPRIRRIRDILAARAE